MGGFGAIRNGLKYYDTFGYIAVLSGALQVFEAPPDSPYWSLFGERSVFGGPDRDRSDDLTDANRTLSQTELRAQINSSKSGTEE